MENNYLTHTPNWKSDIKLDYKCGSCKHYEVFIKKGVLTAHGYCQLRGNTYKQRTDSCLKYDEKCNIKE